MEIRKINKNFVVDGIRIYLGEIIIIAYDIMIISIEDMNAERIKLTPRRLAAIYKNSDPIEEIY